MLLAVFVVAGTLAFQGVSGRRYRPPIFLEPRECLEFEVLCNVSDFQARSYNSSRWVGVPFPNVSEFRRSFRCLKRYAKGQNSQGLPILMTAQFLVSFNGSRPLSLFWLLPKNRQVNPPLPVNGSRVFIASFPQMFVYSKTVRTSFSRLSGEAQTLNASLAAVGASYNDSTNLAAFCKRGRVSRGRRSRSTKRDPGIRKKRGVAENVQQMVGDIFDEEGELSGFGELPLPFEEQAEVKMQARKRRNWQNRRKCYDISFISNRFPICPIS